MAQWVKLTLATNGKQFRLNLDQATMIDPSGNGGSIITLTSGSAVVVNEQAEDIVLSAGLAKS